MLQPSDHANHQRCLSIHNPPTETFKILFKVQKAIAWHIEIFSKIAVRQRICRIQRSLSNFLLLPHCGNLSKIQMVKDTFYTLYMHAQCAIFHNLSIFTFQGKENAHMFCVLYLWFWLYLCWRRSRLVHHKILNSAANLLHTSWHAEEVLTFLPPKKADTQRAVSKEMQLSTDLAQRWWGIGNKSQGGYSAFEQPEICFSSPHVTVSVSEHLYAQHSSSQTLLRLRKLSVLGLLLFFPLKRRYRGLF